MSEGIADEAPGAPIPGRPWLALAWLLLALWAAGILVAAVQLDSWRQQLSRTLLQLNADAVFRARVPNREAVDPEWYRHKALELLAATERLQNDAAWTAFLPGSWRAFDNLEEQVQARIGREFSDIVVETLRRELYARASRLTGVPLVRGTGDLQGGAECKSPVPRVLERRLTSAPEDLPEFVAVADYVDGVAQLDAAAQSLLSLQHSSGSPDQLRKLVAYTLGKELPGALEGAVHMFRGNEEMSIQPALMQARLQWATRCALDKAMGALYTRLLNTNELFALEQGYVARSAGLFEPAARMPFDRTMERYRAVHALLEDQHALLARGGNGWMGQGTLQLGPAYQRILKRITATQLLGPEVLQQLQGRSGAAFAEFRRQFEQAFGSRGEAGIVWLEGERRFGLSPQRAALREGLGALLKTSFMADEAAAGGSKTRETVSLARVLQQARALSEERARVNTEVVPLFPEHARPVVARVIDVRISELIYQSAFRSLKAAQPEHLSAPLDVVAFREQREQVRALQAVLKETGGSWFGDRLASVLDAELLRRLALLQQDWAQFPMQDPRAASFAGWQGEPLGLALALGADAGGVPLPTFSRMATRLDLLVQQARTLLALGSPALPADPAAARWVELQAELQRYTARASDSSLLRLERYLGALGPDLKRENCVERLGAQAPVALHDDPIAQRHVQLHQALTQRCGELRAQAPMPAASLAQ